MGEAKERLRRRQKKTAERIAEEEARRMLVHDTYSASLQSFERSWGNPEDSIYDS